MKVAALMESLLLAVEQAIALGEFKKEYLDVVVWFFEEFALLVELDEIAVDEEVRWIVETVWKLLQLHKFGII